jgi:hypothetical protein
MGSAGRWPATRDALSKVMMLPAGGRHYHDRRGHFGW